MVLKKKAMFSGNKNRLKEFHKKLAGLKFLDPACGCGNFLVVTYRDRRSVSVRGAMGGATSGSATETLGVEPPKEKPNRLRNLTQERHTPIQWFCS